MQNLLNGLKPEHGGQYVIAENGIVRVASDQSISGEIDKYEITQQLSSVQKDVGTTFRTRLTFTIDKQFEEAATPTATETADNNPMQVLLVEDNELNMEVSSFMLEEQGANVTKAWNGKQAVEIFLSAEEGHFDLVLMDLMMPEMMVCKRRKPYATADEPTHKCRFTQCRQTPLTRTCKTALT